MKKDKNIDELFRDKLLNYGQEPPAFILGNVLSGAAGDRRKRKIIFWRLVSTAAAILLAFVAGWQLNYMNSKTIVLPVIVSQNSTPETKSAITAKVLAESKTAKNDLLKRQVIPEATGKPISNKTLMTASQSTIQEKKTSPETTGNVPTDEITALNPIQRLTHQFNQNDRFAEVLHKMKAGNTNSEQNEKSIDQQIMEQNQLMMLAQNEKVKKGRWLVGAQVNPEYSVSRSNHSQVYASNMINSSSANPVDLGGGLSVEFKKGKRWSLQSGVYYSGVGQSSGNSSHSNGNDLAYAGIAANNLNTNVRIDANTNKMVMNSTAGVIELKKIPSSITVGTNMEDKSLASTVIISDARFIQNFDYIEIPLYLRYTILDSRFDVEMLGGFSSNLLVGNETYVESSSGKSLVGKTNDMQTMNYSGTLGIGLKYGLSKRIFLNVEPRVKYYLNSLNNNLSVTYKPYIIGVFTGLSYQF